MAHPVSPSPPSPPSKLRKQSPPPCVSPVFKSGSVESISSHENSYIASKWKIGWRTPLMMILTFVLGKVESSRKKDHHTDLYQTALLLAFGHLGLFLYLDKRPADGKDRAAPQSYISTASNIISNAFALSLKASLAVAFTQYLWFTLRRSTLKVSTIDSLFGVRSNVFLLFDRLVISRGPFLVLIAIMMWSLQIVASFPGGALTIESTIQTWNQTMDVPTFNASFVIFALSSHQYLF